MIIPIRNSPPRRNFSAKIRPSSCISKEPRHQPTTTDENAALQSIKCESSINLQKINTAFMLERPKYGFSRCPSTVASTEQSKPVKKSIGSQVLLQLKNDTPPVYNNNLFTV
jgi:hypothetical protein